MKYAFKYTMNCHGQNYFEKYFDLRHNNLDIAKENLRRIGEHYSQYKNKKDEEILKANQDKPWFVKDEKLCVFFIHDTDKKYQIISEDQKKDFQDESQYQLGTFIDNITAHFYIRLLNDENEPVVFLCPWCNSLDKLNSFEIEEIDSDLKLTF